jgi:ABC-type uncharacterized transport system involved in gliding motility auxiliary subunit
MVLLDQYRAQTNKFVVQTIDPEAQPSLAGQYLATNETLVIVFGQRHVTVSNLTESDITSALLKVMRATQPVVYYTTGHGEPDMADAGGTGYSMLQAFIERDGFQIKPLMLVTTNTIPSDAGAVIIDGPHVPLQSREVDVVRTYLARGGRLMVTLDTSLTTNNHALGDAGLGGLLSEWGITLRDDWVLDPVSSQVTDPGVNIAAQYGSSPIVDKLRNLPTVFPAARSLVLASQAPANVTMTPLVLTSDQSWGASELDNVLAGLRQGYLPNGPGAKDAKGPLVVAASATNSQTSARLVAVGTSAFATNDILNKYGTSNFDLYLNSLNWLVEQESQITIRPKPFETRQLIPSGAMTIQVLGISIILMPLVVLVAGAIVWWRRR